MPEITANIKVVLGIVAATAALITGLLGNVLAANISAFFSGTEKKPAKRPVLLWVVFFISALLSIVAGSVATFSPPAAAEPLPPTHQAEEKPKVVMTNSSGSLQRDDTKDQFFICRDTLEIANTSDISTSVVGVGTDLQVDGTAIQFQPIDTTSTWSNSQVSVQVSVWRTAPSTKRYANARSLDQFASIQGEPLPVKVDGRSTASVDVDYALKFTSGAPDTITATHTLRFPDIPEVKTGTVECK